MEIRRISAKAKFADYSLTFTMKGTIKRVTDKGFGFIAPETGDKDVFFHSSSLVDVTFDELREGDQVTFEVAESPKGPNAVKVSKVA